MKALSDETRFKIVNLLLEKNYCVRALSKQLKISESAVSQHLKREMKKMSKSKCEKPELMPKDGKCSKDLIEKCHGKEKIIHTIKIANN